MTWFSNLNALPKLVISFGLVTLLSIVTGAVALKNLGRANDQVAVAYSSDIDGMAQVDSIDSAKLGMARLTRDALLKINDKAAVAQDIKAFGALATDTQKNIAEAQDAFNGQAGKAQITEIAELFPRYVEMCQDILMKAEAGDASGGLKALEAVSPIAKKLNADTAAAADAKHRRARAVSAASQANFRSTQIFLIALITSCGGVGIGMSLWIGRLFSLPLGVVVWRLKKVADGDLTGSTPLDTRDEVGIMAGALDDAIHKVREALEAVALASNSVRSSSVELATTSQSMADGAQEQAASLEETAASLEEITATMRQSAENAKEASRVAANSGDAATQGGIVVAEAVSAMSEINAASAKIAVIITTINEIAFQTNLLAVNASVEAARAGDQGRGFAVVASEVRKLAQRTAEAAKEIKGLIQDSQRKVERGTHLVNRSGETLDGIVKAVKRVTDIVGEIAASAEEQSIGIDQVNEAMTQMDQVTQSNALQTEQLSSTAQQLAERAAHMMSLMEKFHMRRSSAADRDAYERQFRNAAPSSSPVRGAARSRKLATALAQAPASAARP